MKVYVAGPEVFRKDAKYHLELVRMVMSQHGLTALIPIDNEVEAAGKHPGEVAEAIYKGNVKMIDECDVVLASIAPFRGVHMDPGTAFEIGYAIAKNKPVYCYTPHASESIVDRLDYWEEDNGVFLDEENMIVENFGETENLMITIPCKGVFENVQDAIKAIKDE